MSWVTILVRLFPFSCCRRGTECGKTNNGVVSNGAKFLLPLTHTHSFCPPLQSMFAHIFCVLFLARKDALLLRFIRARKWNTINALSMMFKAFKWRLDEDIPAVKYSSDIQLNDQNPKFFEQLEMGKFYIKGT